VKTSALILAFFLLFFSGQVSGSDEGSLSVIYNGQGEPYSRVVVEGIHLSGNDITRPRIIFRELLFAEGDTLTQGKLVKNAEISRQNLLNTSLFNFVEMEVVFNEPGNAYVSIGFVERWYLWPIPILEIGYLNLNHWLDEPSFSTLNYGVYITRDNFRGRMQRLELLIRAGYRQNFSLTYDNPYFNARQTFGWRAEVGLHRSHEVPYITRDNRQLNFRSDNGFAYRQYYTRASLSYRPGIFNTHLLTLGYNQYKYADSLLILNPRFGPEGMSEFSFLNISYQFRHDRRDIKAYPLEGHFIDFRINRLGLDLLRDEEMNMTVFELTARKYWPLFAQWYFAAGFKGSANTGSTISYFNRHSLGSREDLVRGYENYVIDGQYYIIFKSNLKYALVPQRTSNIGFIPSEKFSRIHYAVYVNLFADAGTIEDRYYVDGNLLANRWLAGVGLGLDFVTYYDKVMRTELTLNRHGEAGFFIHLTAPI